VKSYFNAKLLILDVNGMDQGPGVLETKKLIVIETHFTPVYKVGSLPTKTRVKSSETRPKTFISKGTQGLSRLRYRSSWMTNFLMSGLLSVTKIHFYPTPYSFSSSQLIRFIYCPRFMVGTGG
jgi:hypothetical protein